jgi:hypothetical protein
MRPAAAGLLGLCFPWVVGKLQTYPTLWFLGLGGWKPPPR